MKLDRILKGVRYTAAADIRGIDIRNVTDDSREVSRGDLFVAVRGHSADGAKYIGSAIGAGARAVVADRDYDTAGAAAKILVRDARGALSLIAGNYYRHPSDNLKVIGITGTNGKTTITYLIESILNVSGRGSGVIGTINYRLKEKVMPAVNTTPGALALHRMLSEMVRKKIGYAVMEVSSHSLDQGRVDGILFDAGVFTNLTGDHLDYHKTRAKYFNAKKKLFDKLKGRGRAVLNADDRMAASLKRSLKDKAISYGVRPGADVTARDVSLSMDGTAFTVKMPGGNFRINTKLVGIHNVSNILAAAAVSIALRIPRQAIIGGIESMTSVPGRLEAVEAGQSFKVLVDFAHTEDALLNVLSLLKQVAGRRILTLFGCGGNRDRTKRPRMGRIACEYSDHVIVTSDNPRHEDPDAIIDEIEAGIRGRFSNYDRIADRREAIDRALSLASEGDIVVLAGKGHESCQIIGNESMPFDDRKVARSILEENYKRGKSV